MGDDHPLASGNASDIKKKKARHEKDPPHPQTENF